MQFDVSGEHKWAPPSSCMTVCETGFASRTSQRSGTATQTARGAPLVTKRMSGGHVPYEMGDLRGGLFVARPCMLECACF